MATPYDLVVGRKLSSRGPEPTYSQLPMEMLWTMEVVKRFKAAVEVLQRASYLHFNVLWAPASPFLRFCESGMILARLCPT